MAKILGLDLGTNSIGWAVVDNEKNSIEAAGSRIIPMDAGLMGD
jgi:CRISPR-associated endonuclease Csn1